MSHTTTCSSGFVLTLLLVLALASSAWASGISAAMGPLPSSGNPLPAKPVPSESATEVHHSLHPPLDQSQVYWNFGGSTVMSHDGIRITPAAQNRRGWLWNDYPIESENWEVEFDLNVFSKPHFGGDGMGFWMLASSQDPTFQSDTMWLTGDIFGIRKDFQGLGVVFDVYDNDGKRNNPMIFVLHNPDGKETNYNHDNDYADDMYKRVPTGSSHTAFSCVAGIRNTATPVKVLIKFVQKVLTVAVDTDDGLGYKFCLAVEFDAPLKDHHIAFTGITGQVADVHEIKKLTTRYLKSTEQNSDDEFLRVPTVAPTCPGHIWFFWLVIIVTGIALFAAAVHELQSFKQYANADINPVVVCQQMNAIIVPHYYAHLALSALLLVSFNLVAFALNAPLVAWRLYQFTRRSYMLTPAQLGGERVHGNRGLSVAQRLYITILSYVISIVYYIYSWLMC